MRRLLVLLTALAAAPAIAAEKPEKIALPPGWQPEGIASGRGSEVFVGSIPTGRIWAADVRTGKGAVRVEPPAGRAAIGLKHHGGKLFVAGGTTGSLFVYDARTGADRGAFPVEGQFINDVVVTRGRAWFTDSRRPVLYSLRTNLRSQPRTVPLSGDIQYVEGNNANGIVSARGGRVLIVVQGNVGKLFTVNPRTGASREIRLLGGANVMNGDGMLLRGRTLYVVQNRLNKIAVVRLSPTLRSGRVIRELTDPDFAVPTTIAHRNGDIHAVNAKFGTPPEGTPYEIVRVDGT